MNIVTNTTCILIIAYIILGGSPSLYRCTKWRAKSQNSIKTLYTKNRVLIHACALRFVINFAYTIECPDGNFIHWSESRIPRYRSHIIRTEIFVLLPCATDTKKIMYRRVDRSYAHATSLIISIYPSSGRAHEDYLCVSNSHFYNVPVKYDA